MQKYCKINVGQTCPRHDEALDLALEHDAVSPEPRDRARHREGRQRHAALFEKILVSEEEHIDWIEAQLQQIKDIGVENYRPSRSPSGGLV